MPAPTLKGLKDTLDRVVFHSDQPIVVALKGGWGEGKTFFWKNDIAASHAAERPGYVSVFGANTVQSIREKVLLAALLSKLPPATKGIFGKLVEIVRQHATAAVSLARGLRIPDTLLTHFLERTTLTPGWILCLDDIERLSDSVGVDALLGYINELRDERQLKVVLIYNDDASAINNEAFRKYHEKVVDRELAFSPDVSEILHLVFETTSSINRDPQLLGELARRCDVLHLRNFRLIAKARNYYQELEQVLPPDANQQFRNTALFSLLLLVWVKFSKSDLNALTLEFLSDYPASSVMFDRESLPEQQQPSDSDRAKELLTQYGYEFTDDLDTILIDFVRTDTLDTEKLIQEYEKHVQNLSKRLLEQRFSEAWHKYYHGTLRNTEEEFCAALASATKEYMEFISVNRLDEALSVLTRLGRDSAAELLLNDFLRIRGESLKHFQRWDLTGPVKYRKLDEALQEREHATSIDQRSIGDVVESALASNSPGIADRKRLAQFTTQEFVFFQ